MNKTELINTLMGKYEETYQKGWEYFGLSVDSMMNNDSGHWLQMFSDSSIIMLTPQLKNVGNYLFRKNIYDFLVIDTLRTQVVYFNIKNSIISVVGDDNYQFDMKLSKKERRKWLSVIETLKKEKPDAVLAQGEIFRNSDDNVNSFNILYLKDNEIYVISLKSGKIYELNHYVRKFFKEREFKERAINDRNGIVIYGHDINNYL